MARTARSGARDKPLTPFTIPLTGRWRPNVDPLQLGEGDFATLDNMRPNEGGIQTVQGMTKINTSALANVNINTGIHFLKNDPVSESHVMAHAYDANGINGKVYRNTGTIPSQNNFTATAVFSDSSGAGTPRFCIAPRGMLSYCNGVDNVLWPGLEGLCAGYIDYNPDKSYRYNYIRQITNNLQDANNVAAIHKYTNPLDANVVALYHFNTDLNDSTAGAHNATAVGGAAITAAQAKFGAGSLQLDGVNDYATIPNHADFDWSTASGSDGNFCVDMWIRSNSGGLSAVPYGTFYSHAKASGGAKTYVRLYRPISGTLTFDIINADAVEMRLQYNIRTSAWANPGWSHIEISGKKLGAGSYQCFLFFNGQLVATGTHANAPDAPDRDVVIGAWDDGNTISDYMGSPSGPKVDQIDELRISKIYRHTVSFEPEVREYGSGSTTSIYIGSPLPIQGINWYVKTVNATAGSSYVYQWTSSGWSDVGTITGAGGTVFSTTGKNSWTFASTASTAKQKIIDGGLAYWYKVEILDCDTATRIYQVTLDMPMQPIQDLWDGIYRRTASFQKYVAGVFQDFTVNVFKEEYDPTNAATFVELDGLTTSQYLYYGSFERLQGLRFALIGGHANTTASTAMIVETWDGDSWNGVAGLDDGTAEAGISLAKSGLVTWTAPDLENEFETDLPGATRPAGKTLDQELAASGLRGFGAIAFLKVISDAKASGATNIDKPPLYYYRISFSQTLSADVQVYFIGGIPAQTDLKSQDFTFEHINRLWMVKNNTVISSQHSTAQVFNGDDSLGFTVGDSANVIGAASLTARVGNSIFAALLLFKKGELWTLIGDDPNTMIGPLKIANIGLVAPETLRIIPAFELGPGVSRPVAVWQGGDGIYMSDGFSINMLHGDIADRFDDRKTTVINRTYAHKSFGAYDERFNEYHWCYPETGSTTPNRELVFKFGATYSKWFSITRTGKSVVAFIPVRDTIGNSYLYGAIAGGYLERLENGSSFDGNDIVSTVRFADRAFGSLMNRSTIRHLRFFMIKKSTTAKFTITHYGDTRTASTVPGQSAVAINDSSTRLAWDDTPRGMSWGPFNVHGLQLTHTCNDVDVPIELVAVAGLVHVESYETGGR